MEKLILIIAAIIGVVIEKMIYNICKTHKSHKGNKNDITERSVKQ